MVIWTPEQWEKELNEFAAAIRKKKFNKIPYDDWRMMWSWRSLPSTTDIYLKSCEDASIMISPYGVIDHTFLLKVKQIGRL